MKRSDISDKTVCEAYDRYKKIPFEKFDGRFALEHLVEMTGAPEKVAYRAMERAYDRCYIECGVSLRSGWLTEKGMELLKQA